MGGHIIGGSDEFTQEDIAKLQRKVNALNTAPALDTMENVEAAFNNLEAIRAAEKQVHDEELWVGIRRAVGIGVGLFTLTTVQVVLVLLGMKLGMSFEWSALIVVLLNINIGGLAAFRISR